MIRAVCCALAGIAAAASAAAADPAYVRSLLERGDWLLAGSILESSLARASPDSRPKLLPLLARSLELGGRYAEAAVQLLILAEEQPDAPGTPGVLLQAGRLLERSGAAAAAREAFYRSVQASLRRATAGEALSELDALTVEAAWEIARSEAETGEPARAVELIRRFRLMLQPGDARSARSGFVEMRALARLGRMEEAVAVGWNAVQEWADDPERREILVELARLLVLLGRTEEARAALHTLGAPPAEDAVALRVAEIAVEVHRDDPLALLEIREAARTRANDPAWAPLASRIDEVLSRQPSIKMPVGGLPGVDRWRGWSQDFQSGVDQLRRLTGLP